MDPSGAVQTRLSSRGAKRLGDPLDCAHHRGIAAPYNDSMFHSGRVGRGPVETNTGQL